MAMPSWKQALVYGSIGAGALLLLTGRRPAGLVLAGVGLAALASEYPEKFEELWEAAPEYVEKGARIVQTLSRMGERLAEGASYRGLRAVPND
jgi:hypothetical protein